MSDLSWELSRVDYSWEPPDTQPCYWTARVPYPGSTVPRAVIVLNADLKKAAYWSDSSQRGVNVEIPPELTDEGDVKRYVETLWRMSQ